MATVHNVHMVCSDTARPRFTTRISEPEAHRESFNKWMCKVLIHIISFLFSLPPSLSVSPSPTSSVPHRNDRVCVPLLAGCDPFKRFILCTFSGVVVSSHIAYAPNRMSVSTVRNDEAMKPKYFPYFES